MKFRKIISCVVALSYTLNIWPLFAMDFPVKYEKDYFISAGDVINMTVYPADEFSKEVTVQPDGTIEIPLIGAVKVAGMKAEDLEKLLVAKFSKYISNPSITINVRKFSAYRVAIIGQVHRTGYYDFTEGMKILDLIALAGGLQDYAKTKDVKIFRKIKDVNGTIKEDVLDINLGEILDGKLNKNIELVAGDIVYIPRKKFTTVSKWIADNLIPWTMIGTFAITIGIISRK